MPQQDGSSQPLAGRGIEIANSAGFLDLSAHPKYGQRDSQEKKREQKPWPLVAWLLAWLFLRCRARFHLSKAITNWQPATM